MTVEFKPVETAADQEKLAEIACEIWNEFWPAHIGQDQTDYMVKNFQSLEAIRRDMALEPEPYEYWFIYNDGELAGYTGGHNEQATNRFFISKIYLFANQRGNHLCSRCIEHYDALCKARNLHAMYLTVNKGNEGAIRAYAAKGFETIDAVVSDIGQGFVMDDYIMERPA